MADVLLDASAVLALLRNETGAEIVADMAPSWAVSAVNAAEVAARLADAAMPDSEISETFLDLNFEIIDFDFETAILTGVLRSLTRDKGLSLGDRACLASGKRHDLPILTADRLWKGLDVGVEIRLIR